MPQRRALRLFPDRRHALDFLDHDWRHWSIQAARSHERLDETAAARFGA
jgi:hypothetical protein